MAMGMQDVMTQSIGTYCIHITTANVTHTVYGYGYAGRHDTVYRYVLYTYNNSECYTHSTWLWACRTS